MAGLRVLIILTILSLAALCKAGDDTSLSVPVSGGQQTEQRVQKFLTPDGRFDIEAVRASGYQGALDIEGVDIALDPVTVEPIVRNKTQLSPSDSPDDIYWDNSLSINSIDFDYIYISALAIYNDTLIAGGRYEIDYSDTAFIQAWNGSSWSDIGSEITSEEYLAINALTVYDDKLIVAGYFTSVGDTIVNNIVAWDGSTWSSLGGGVHDSINNTYITVLTVYDNKLIVGGYFTTAGGVSVENIAAWDGSYWHSLGSTGMGSVYALTEYENALIAAGEPGYDSVSIAMLNESLWIPMAETDGSVDALTVYKSNLIASGRFLNINEITTNHIATWNDTTWSALGEGLSEVEGNLSVPALFVYGDKLIAGGDFVEAGNDSAFHIAMWNDSSWSVMGSGTDKSVYA